MQSSRGRRNPSKTHNKETGRHTILRKLYDIYIRKLDRLSFIKKTT